MTWQAWYTLGALALMVGALVRGVARTELVLLGTLALLLVAGVIGPVEAFAGFSNPAVVAIGSLFVVAAGIDRTGALGFLDGLLRPRSPAVGPAVWRVMAPTALLSGVLNNTPIVAMLIPRVQAWHRKGGTPPASKLLIPLSTAAIVGGWLTLIGTSTNVVVHGLLQAEGLPGFGFFTLAWVGVPAVVVVVLYYGLIGHRLLPANDAVSAPDARRGYSFELRVGARAPFAGKTVEDAGFRTLGDAYLARIERDGRAFEAEPEAVLLAADVLTFVGGSDAIDDLLLRPGLERTAPTNGDDGPDLELFEVVVAAGSRIEGRTLRELGFRERYGGVVLALQRRAEDMAGGLGRVPLRAGDLLLVEGGSALPARLGALADDFALVSPVGTVRPVTRRAPVALALLVSAIALTAFGVLPLATATFAAALGMVATGCLRGGLGRAVDVPVLLVIGAALGIGAAVEATGLAALAAVGIERVAPFGPVATLAVVYLLANGLAELITNKASAVLMLPVALTVAADLGAPWLPFAVAVAIGSAASFLTPIGYQTNLMVMAAGRYRYTDFARAGLPVSLLVFAVTMTMCVLVWL